MPPPDTNSSMIAKVMLIFNFRCAEGNHLVNLAFCLCSIIAILVSCFKFLSLFISSIGKNCYFKTSIVFLRHVFYELMAKCNGNWNVSKGTNAFIGFRSKAFSMLLNFRICQQLFSSNQQFWHTDEANELFFVVLTPSLVCMQLKNKRNFGHRLNCNNSYSRCEK